MIKKLLLSAICFIIATVSVSANEGIMDGPNPCYLVGTYNGWDTPNENNTDSMYKLWDEDGDGLYMGTFNFAADEFDFKIFLGIADWSQSDMYFGTDEAVTMNGISTEKAYATVSPGNLNFTCKDWPGGEVDITYDYLNSTVTFSTGLGNIYLNIWGDITIENFPKVFQTGEGVYSTTIKAEAAESIGFQFISDTQFTEVYCPTEQTTLEFTDNVFTGEFQTVTSENQSAARDWTIENFQGGELTFTIDFNTNTISVKQRIIEDCVYLIGDLSGWKSPDASNEEALKDYRLLPLSPGYYAGEINVEAGKFMFRIYTALTGWEGGDSYGCQEDDTPTDFELPTDGKFQGSVVKGKGAWNFPAWEGGKVKIIFDMAAMTIEVYDLTSGIEDIEVENGEAQFFNLQGIRVANPENGLYIRVQNGKATKVIL